MQDKYLLEFHNSPTRLTIPVDRICSSLQREREIIDTRRGINLRPLKKAVSMLPNYAPPDEDTKCLLEQISAIVFHTDFRIAVRLAKKFFEEHPTPEKSTSVRTSPSHLRPTLDSLLDF